MRLSYYTNFIIDEKTDRVLLGLDYDTGLESLRGALEFADVDGIYVDRVGPLSDAPLFETPSEIEEIVDRIAY